MLFPASSSLTKMNLTCRTAISGSNGVFGKLLKNLSFPPTCLSRTTLSHTSLAFLRTFRYDIVCPITAISTRNDMASVGVGVEVGGVGAPAATCAQLCVIFTCSSAFFFIISIRVWFCVSSAANSRLALLYSLKERFVLFP